MKYILELTYYRNQNNINRELKEAYIVEATMLVNNETYLITLNDSKTARDFIELLPLELDLIDFKQTQKIGDLPRRLDVSDASEGVAGKTGDISYYAPWGNLAIFYKDSLYNKGLVKLGESTDFINAFHKQDTVTVRFEEK